MVEDFTRAAHHNQQELEVKREKRHTTTQHTTTDGVYTTMVIHSGLPSFDCNIAILGAGGVGKTALLSSLFGQNFPEKHVPTLDDYFMHTIAVDHVHYNLRIVDTSGTYNFPAMRNFAINGCEGFVIVFSLDSLKSFEQAIRLLDEVIAIRKDKAETTKKIPVVLVASKLDIADCNNQREVSASQGKGELEARTDNIIAEYVEVSVKMGFPVETDVFHPLVKTLTAVDSERKRSRLISMITMRKNVSKTATKCFKRKKRRKLLRRALRCVLAKRETC